MMTPCEYLPWVAMMHGSSSGKVLGRDAYMYHDDQGHNTLKHYTAFMMKPYLTLLATHSLETNITKQLPGPT